MVRKRLMNAETDKINETDRLTKIETETDGHILPICHHKQTQSKTEERKQRKGGYQYDTHKPLGEDRR